MNNAPKTVAIIGAGASGLMVADVLSRYDVRVAVYEQMPSAGRKILWAGKTGLNVTHSEPMSEFVARYTPSDWLAPMLYHYDTQWLRDWFGELGIKTFVGSSGRVFPVEMKASKFLRAWLQRLGSQGVQFFYRHACEKIDGNAITFNVQNNDKITQFTQSFDAIVLACGGGSYRRLGSDGVWQAWFGADELMPLYASNVGVVRQWSAFMQDYFGQALKGVKLWTGDRQTAKQGDIVVSHYGFEGGLIYQANRAMRQSLVDKGEIELRLDLLPDKQLNDIVQIFNKNRKQSLSNLFRKLGLDPLKIALLRECTPKSDWQDKTAMANHIKALHISFDGFRPMDEAISTGGGVVRDCLTDSLQLKRDKRIFCVGEMLDFDAPTGGYLLTACFAMGQVAGYGVVDFLTLAKK